MIELEKKFIGTGEVKGSLFEQIEESEAGYIYKVTRGKSVYYEVFQKIKQKAAIIEKDGIAFDLKEKELYPKANSFGVSAFTFSDINRAYERFYELKLKKA